MWETIGVHTDRIRIAIIPAHTVPPIAARQNCPPQTLLLLTCASLAFLLPVLVLVLAALVIVVVDVIFVVGVHAAVAFRRTGLLLDDILLILIL
jgi:hypothetical protein